jgi:hypothetical protein
LPFLPLNNFLLLHIFFCILRVISKNQELYYQLKCLLYHFEMTV